MLEVLSKPAAGRYEQSLKMKYTLLLAARRAEDGDKATCAKVCRTIPTSELPEFGNARCAALEVLADNASALRAYQKQGFTRDPAHPNTDTFFLRKSLAEAGDH